MQGAIGVVVGGVLPAQFESWKFASSRGEFAQEYLVLFGLMRPAVDVGVAGRVEAAAERRQGQLGVALAAAEALRVVPLTGAGLDLLQRVDRLTAPEAGRHAAISGKSDVGRDELFHRLFLDVCLGFGELWFRRCFFL